MKSFILTFAFVTTLGLTPCGFADEAVMATVPTHKAAPLTAGPELESATALWRSALRHRCQEPDSGRTVAQSPQSFASRYDFPRAHHETQFEYHLLLQGGIHRRHRRERWSVQFCENIQDTVALRKAGEREPALTERSHVPAAAGVGRRDLGSAASNCPLPSARHQAAANCCLQNQQFLRRSFPDRGERNAGIESNEPSFMLNRESKQIYVGQLPRSMNSGRIHDIRIQQTDFIRPELHDTDTPVLRDWT